MPRWRRPSLIKARMSDPGADAADAAVARRLSFERDHPAPIGSSERRRIGYNLVRLLDRPDETGGLEIGFLDQGDEVQLVEKSGVYWLVRSPDGLEGWLHKMTLAKPEDAAVPPPGRQPAPLVADPWAVADDAPDAGVLAAYLEQRRLG
ncbi:MAG: SH3 domain-containing protein [Candidatus Limnocylindrales bacterium]